MGHQAQVVEHIQSEVAPYVYQNRTYIPFGLLADALSYNVGWDGEVAAVIIDDVDAILAANTETYDRMDEYQPITAPLWRKTRRSPAAIPWT